MRHQRDKRGPEQGAPHGTQAPHHHHDHQVQRFKDIEGLRVDVAEVVGVQAAGHGREDRGQDKDLDFVAPHVNPQRGRGHFVLGQGRQPPPYPAAHQVEAQGQGHQSEGPDQIMELEVTVEGQAADGQGRHPGQAAGTAGDRVPLHKNAVHHVVEAQGGHGEIMPGEPQAGNAQDQGHKSYYQRGQGHGRPGGPTVGGGKYGRTVGPQAEKRRVPQGNLAGKADEQIEAQNHDDIEADEVEQAQFVRIAHDQGRERQDHGQSPHQKPGVVATDK